MNNENKPHEMNSGSAEENGGKENTASVGADSETSEQSDTKAEPSAQTDTAEEAAPEEGVSPAAEEDAEETPEEEKPEKREKKKQGKPAFFKSEKFKHGSTATAFTAGFIVIVVLLNVIVGILGNKFPSMNLDMTKSGENTLSDEACKIVDEVKIPVTVYICNTKQATESSYTQVASLTAKIQERNSKIKVEYKDLDKDPTFAANYQSDNLALGDVIVRSDKRYRVLTTSDLYTTKYSSDYRSSSTYSNVDSALASALNTVISEALPIASFDTGHGEKMDSSAYQQLLKNNSFDTKEFNLLTDNIPDKTQLLVLGCPMTDYTDAEIEKLGNYLKNSKVAGDRSLLITYSAGLESEKTMPKFSTFLQEWGLAVSPSKAVVETSGSNCFANNPHYLLADVQTKLSLGGAGSSYSNLLVPYSCPVSIKFKGRDSKATYSLIKSGSTSFVYQSGDAVSSSPKTSAQDIAALCQDSVKVDDKTYHANVIVMGSAMMFTGDYINTSAFANSSYLVDLSKYATGTSTSAAKISTKNTELYAKDIVMNTTTARVLGLGVFTILIPLLVAVAGIIVHRKRRML